MKLRDQVVNLKLSKKLKKIGYPQKGLWYWKDFKEMGMEYKKGFRYGLMGIGGNWVVAVAPTVSELGELLPEGIDNKQLHIDKLPDIWGVRYTAFGQKGLYKTTQVEKNLVDTMAKMLIWLVEKNHLTFKKKK